MTDRVRGPVTPVGVFGLGNMGAAIAGRLGAHGPVLAYDPDEARSTRAADLPGVAVADDPAEVAGTAHTVVLSLPTPAVSRQVVEDLAAQARGGTLVIETSTVTPMDARGLADLCGDAALRFVDAAILSGVAQVQDGTSMLLLGGADADLDAAAPVLDALASRQQRFGPVGSGMAAKVLNNAVAHAVMVVLVEAGAMAAANGVRRRDLADLLSAEDAGLHRPLTHRFVERVLEGAYDGGMPTEAARKDSVLALELARDGATPLFAIQAAHTVYELAVAAGLGRQDYAAIAQLWETWTGAPFPDQTEEAGR
jgi:3-hydroxyisobutyrate dehydrogenase-like beta-hydroxyacid dehydrogenase